MKKYMFRLVLLMFISMPLVFTSCSEESNKEEDSGSQTSNNPERTVPEPEVSTESKISFASQETTDIVNAYLEIKDGLVSTDGALAKAAAKKLVASMGESEDALLSKIKFDAEHIGETEDTGHQRDHFNTLSDNVLQLAKAAESKGGNLFVQFCPMAFDNTGAFWISNSSEIMNPYFGDQMLHCGKVQEEL